MSVKNLLTETVTVQELTTAVNAFKGSTKTFSNRTGLVNVKAGFRARKLDENQEFSKTTQRDAWRMYMDYNSASSTIEVTDRVIWGSKTLEVRGVPYNPGGRNVLYHIDCEEIK